MKKQEKRNAQASQELKQNSIDLSNNQKQKNSFNLLKKSINDQNLIDEIQSTNNNLNSSIFKYDNEQKFSSTKNDSIIDDNFSNDNNSTKSNDFSIENELINKENSKNSNELLNESLNENELSSENDSFDEKINQEFNINILNKNNENLQTLSDAKFDENDENVELINEQILRENQQRLQSKIIEKIDNLINRCVFCTIKRNRNAKNHSSANCKKYKNQFKHAYYSMKKAQRLYSNKIYRYRKVDIICSQCFMSTNICFQFRRKYSTSTRLQNCELANDLFCYYFIINYKKTFLKEYKLRNKQVEKHDVTCFANYLSDKYTLLNITISKTLKYILKVRISLLKD